MNTISTAMCFIKFWDSVYQASWFVYIFHLNSPVSDNVTANI